MEIVLGGIDLQQESYFRTRVLDAVKQAPVVRIRLGWRLPALTTPQVATAAVLPGGEACELGLISVCEAVKL